MKQITLTLFFITAIYFVGYSQITFRGCTTSGLGDQDYILNQTGTTNDAGTIRNTFESTPLNFAQTCPAGVCEVRIIWNTGATRWEIQLDNDGPLNTPDYTTAVLYFNTTGSAPNPPDLSLGTWVDGSGGICPASELTRLSGDVQNTVSGTQPVELTYFFGKRMGDEINLRWQTEIENNNSHFELQRSTDGIEFNVIGKISGAGSTTFVQNYTYQDKEPLTGVNYYRLNQVDFDGTATLTQIIAVEYDLGDKSRFQVFPSPTKNILHVELETLPRQGHTYRIMDIAGHVVQEGSFSNQVQKYTLSIAALQDGVYVLQINDEETTKTIRFVKQ